MSGIYTSQVSVTNAITLIVAARGDRQAVLLYNAGSATVYIDAAQQGLTTSTGHALPAGSSITIPGQGPVYGITASATCVVTVLEQE